MSRKPYPGAPVARHFKVQSATVSKAEPAPIGERHVRHVIGRIEALPQAVQYAIALFMTSVVFIIDVITGPELAFSVFYLLPISMLAWHRGWRPARIAVLVSGLAWLLADVLSGNQYSLQAIQYWNALVRTSFFFIVAYTITQLRRAVKEQQRLARTDVLTGAANSRWLLELTEREIQRQKRYLHPLSMAFLDCDNFKQVNDRFGHAAGDDLLRRIATAVRMTTREVDVVARLGGDEFAVLLPETDAHAADTVCAKVRDALQHAVRDFNVTFSIGLVTFLRPAASVDELLHSADQVMYEAKNAGKNRSRHAIVGGPRAEGTHA